MKILLVGSGGREHALAWKILQSPLVTRLVAAPCNPGIEALCECRPVGAADVEALCALALEIGADLVVVGPEAALEKGLADRLQALGVPCFGASAKAARLESSKAFTKDFAERHRLPTAAFRTVTDVDSAKTFFEAHPAAHYVVKADGLAAGKGVVIADTVQEACVAVEDMLGGRFGDAGAQVVVEEFMVGEEASLFALCDGVNWRLFGGAQDHKRAYDGDQGPNTGGMGTYSPAPVLTEAVAEAAARTLIAPTVTGMAAEGAPYRGVLYAGLMCTDEGPKLVEYNARFGDPECQVLMLRLKSDIAPYLMACAVGRLAEQPPLQWHDEAAICVVLAAKGYPEAPETGSVIGGAEQTFGEEVVVFHAGTKRGEDGALLAAGGRVLNVCARGGSLQEARDRAYAAIARIDWPGGFHRTDIGWRGL
jgi:phosphoribosylamine---glycine ligase